MSRRGRESEGGGYRMKDELKLKGRKATRVEKRAAERKDPGQGKNSLIRGSRGWRRAMDWRTEFALLYSFLFPFCSRLQSISHLPSLSWLTNLSLHLLLLLPVKNFSVPQVRFEEGLLQLLLQTVTLRVMVVPQLSVLGRP